MLITTVAIVLALADKAPTDLLTSTPTPPIQPCVAPPPWADEECRQCMDDACKAYIEQVIECGNDSGCITLVRTNYQIALLACTTCDTEARARGMILTVVPPSQQAWTAQRLIRASQAE